MCRFQRFGIYVVMFREICKTLLSIILIFVYLILAFALAFYALMIEQVRAVFFFFFTAGIQPQVRFIEINA